MITASIAPLTISDVDQLTQLLQGQRADYLEHFHPFHFEFESVQRELALATLDRYWALRLNDSLVGFFMLRGLDAGYSRPSFGVMIAEEHSGKGLARLALTHALDWCRAQSIRRVMLKVAPANTRALNAYLQAGFVPINTCKQSGQRIMEAILEPSS